jgi:hypothetical protein
MFDRYVGLGLNCEVAFQVRRLSGRSDAHVFDWQLTTQESLVHVLRTDFADYLRLPNLELPPDRRYVLDTATGLQFHHLFPTAIDGTIVPGRMARDFPRLRSRADHLIRRWRDTVASDLTVLYLRRDPIDELTPANMIELRDVLRECYPAHRFALLWVRDPEVPGAPGPDDGAVELADAVYAAGVPVAQPRLERWRGDDAAWDRLAPALRALPAPGPVVAAGHG